MIRIDNCCLFQMEMDVFNQNRESSVQLIGFDIFNSVEFPQ